ncbi:NAD-dependent epimerase/dehydratase family protein [Actinoplanes sp. NPDC026670]|uniref:NAD-dependent epimerase/dehydratase family protein n=1 Tax=Actinoplanes sp. NPDC026670 TaxID=3154700 RepID=UPI0033D10BC2
MQFGGRDIDGGPGRRKDLPATFAGKWRTETMTGNREMNLAVVTGGAGFVGGHLVSHLLARGVSVRSLDLRPHDLGKLGDGVDARAVDLCDPAALAAALDGADTIFHLAGNPSGTISVENPRLDFNANALAGFNVLEVVRSMPGVRLVYLSSAMVYGRPPGTICREQDPCRPFYPYGASKLAVEHWLRAYVDAYGIDASLGRAFVVYGEGEDPARAGAEIGQYLRWHLNGLPIRVVGDPHAKIRDFVHVSDLADGLTAIAGRGETGEIYNIGSGTATSLYELVRAIEEATAVPAQVEVDSRDLTDSYPLVADIARLGELGYRPAVGLSDGLRRLAAELGPHPALPALPTVLSRVEKDVVGAVG